jgi:hypothetical protein
MQIRQILINFTKRKEISNDKIIKKNLRNIIKNKKGKNI